MDSTSTNGSFPHPEPSPFSSSESSSQAAAAGTLSLNSPLADGSTKSRKRSLAWVHYGKLDDKTAVCDLCGDKIKTSGNTTNLMMVSTNITVKFNIQYIYNYLYI